MRRGRNPTRELAKRIRGVAREEAGNSAPHVSRYRVTQPSPLIVEELEGDEVLEEGDPDFTIGDALRQHIASYGIAVHDQVLVIHAGGEFHAFDAASSATPVRQRLQAGDYSVENAEPARTLDPSTATTAQLANVVAALIEDMGGTSA